MSLRWAVALADAVFAVHLAVILFNVGGMVVIPLGAWRRWAFVRVFWWRALHLATLAVVALQALFGRACILTIWHAALLRRAGESASSAPLIARWVERAIFWPLPTWFFAALYLAVCVYTIALWRLVPPRRRARSG